jgi:hypothetical protein
MEPKELSDVFVAFPADLDREGLLPSWDDIPKSLKEAGNPWNQMAEKLFHEGGKVSFKEGIDKRTAVRHLGACLKSFQPKHEHKIAGVAMLLSEWAEPTEDSTEED